MRTRSGWVMGIVAAVVVGLMVVESASALSIRREPGYFTIPGGEFTVYGTGLDLTLNGYHEDATYTDATLGLGFQTFCLEQSETYERDPVSFSLEYYAIAGGRNSELIASPDEYGDPISVGTAWLYDEFSRGVLDGYDYDETATRDESAELLQQAVWWLEHETWEDWSDNTFVQLAMAGLGGLTEEEVREDNEGHESQVNSIAVINFIGVDDQGELVDRQSMLVRVPDGGLTVVLLGLGTLGCAALRRRKA